MKHNHKRIGKNHHEAELVAQIATSKWRGITCAVQPNTAMRVLRECRQELDLQVMPNGINVRAVDRGGQPVLLTIYGLDVLQLYMERMYRTGGFACRDSVYSLLGHVHALRAEAGQSYKSWNLQHCQVYMTAARADYLFMAGA